MAKFKIFIDGQAGTTGLQIRQRLLNHPHIEVVTIDHALRRDVQARRDLMASVDVTVLCLPDDAAREAAVMAREVGCRVLDASSAHRTLDGWAYGLPELAPGQRSLIAGSNAVANPGCYATGAILLLRPLIAQAGLPADEAWHINAISGYTGGGDKMIEKYQQGGSSYAAYELGLNHKHLPEIQKWSQLGARPLFQPAVGNFDQGMLVFIPVTHKQALPAAELHQTLQDYYQDEPFVNVRALDEIDADTAPYLTPHGMNGSNHVELYVMGAKDGNYALLIAKLDNLGKGASGAAVQNLNIMLGLEEGLCTRLD